MASTMELTDELRGAVASLIGVRPDEIDAIEPCAYTVRVTERREFKGGRWRRPAAGIVSN